MTTISRLLVSVLAIVFPGFLPRALGVNAGDTVYFRASWTGPGAANANTPVSLAQISQPADFPLHGIVIAAQDTQNSANSVTAVMVDGMAMFAAPSAQFRIVISTWHNGFTLPYTGTVETGAIVGPGWVIGEDPNMAEPSLTIPDGQVWVTSSASDTSPVFEIDGASSRGGPAWPPMMSMVHAAAAALGGFLPHVSAGGMSSVTDTYGLTVQFGESPGFTDSHYDAAAHLALIRPSHAFIWDQVGAACMQYAMDRFGLVDEPLVAPSAGGRVNLFSFSGFPSPVPGNVVAARLAALTEGMSKALAVVCYQANFRYTGRLWGVGDRKFADVSPELDVNPGGPLGSDVPMAVAGLVWDLFDGVGDSDGLAGVRLSDKVVMDPAKENTTGWFRSALDIFSDGAAFDVVDDVISGATSFDAADMTRVLRRGEVFAMWGMGPALYSPVEGTLLNLDANANPRIRIRWRSSSTAELPLRMTSFRLLLLDAALEHVLWRKPQFSLPPGVDYQYQLTVAEVTELNAAALASGAESGVLVVVGAEQGALIPVFSNKVRVNLKPVMRTNVIAVDTSWSSPWNDPSRSKLQAAADYASQFVPAVTLEDGTKVLQDKIGVLSYATSVGLVTDWADASDAVQAIRNAMPDDGGYTDFITVFDSGIEMLNSVKPPVPSVNNSAVEIKKTMTILTDGDYYVPWWNEWQEGESAWKRLQDSGHEILEVVFWSSDGHPPVSVGQNRNAVAMERVPVKNRRSRGVVEVNGNVTTLSIRDRQLPRLLEYVPARFLPFGQSADGDGNPHPNEWGDFEGTPDMAPAATSFHASAGVEQEVKLERVAMWDPVTGAPLAVHFTPRAIIQGPDGSFIAGIALTSDTGEDSASITFEALLDGTYTVIVFADPKSTEPGVWNVKVPLTQPAFASALPAVFEASRSRRWSDGRVSMTFTVPPDGNFAPLVRVLRSQNLQTWEDTGDLVPVNAAGIALWTDRTATEAPRRFYRADRVPLQ